MERWLVMIFQLNIGSKKQCITAEFGVAACRRVLSANRTRTMCCSSALNWWKHDYSDERRDAMLTQAIRYANAPPQVRKTDANIVEVDRMSRKLVKLESNPQGQRELDTNGDTDFVQVS
ncbi:hypothetical protein KIN20_012145 [Parelaphostrongylus tenuis]|uniref:Uncharacterized protein n=1 Tax=Parelaphostrongylus tenuis TaxID=148309 RepID=A0AAD5QMP6_PARTN|nr:hypothetical protein KIN20_012145 [Parelaphostrongylus tenuis]